MKRRQPDRPNAKPPAAGPASPRGWKLLALRLAALVIAPLAILALTELVLRLAGFGYPTHFLLIAHHGTPNFGSLDTFNQNNKFGWRFFGKRLARVPAPISILQQKPSDTTRIFVFGESAAFGDPQPAFGLPRTLQATLELRHPGMKFEVVNAAMTAINSHVIRDIARDCARAHGDIWVIYMGNNEVVGPFGAGTVFGSQTLPLPLIRASLALKSTRLGQFADAVRERWQSRATNRSEWGGMEMFLGQQVAADDPRMTAVYHNFARNLDDIIQAGRDSGAGVVVSTVAVNIKDCAPFASRNRPDLSDSDLAQCRDLVNSAAQAEAAGNRAEAAAKYRAAARLDASNAELQFRLGRCLLASGDMSGAKTSLADARDLDTLRFRCDSRLNDLIRKAATGRDKTLLDDAEKSFADASPDGLPGSNLFYEHVHLTFAGNCLLARTIAEQVEKLLPQNSSTIKPWPAEADCARRLAWTPRDEMAGVSDILTRLTDPPFTTQINHREQIEYLTLKAREAAHADKLDDDLSAVQAAASAHPEDATLEQNLSALELTAGPIEDAEKAARRAAELSPSNEEAWSQLGVTLVQEKKYDEALTAFQQAFDLYPQDVMPLQNVATALAKLGRNDDAMRAYHRALQIEPRFGLAYLGMGQLLDSEGQKDQAEDCYRKALQYRIHRAADLATLARFCRNRQWYEAAATNFDDAVAMSPADPALAAEAGESHFLHGMELAKSQQPALAAGEFQAATRLMPAVIEARLNWAVALYQAQQWNESLEVIEQVLARVPTNATALRYRDLLHQKTAHP